MQRTRERNSIEARRKKFWRSQHLEWMKAYTQLSWFSSVKSILVVLAKTFFQSARYLYSWITAAFSLTYLHPICFKIQQICSLSLHPPQIRKGSPTHFPELYRGHLKCKSQLYFPHVGSNIFMKMTWFEFRCGYTGAEASTKARSCLT